MSRTDKHAPYWTWASWYEPSHSLFCEHRPYWYGRRDPARIHACNLPERPVRHRDGRIRVSVPQCVWGPVYPPRRQARWLVWKRHVPRWFVEHVGHNVERVRARDTLSKFCKEYNATGELADGDFPNWQYRHNARWLWD